MANANCLGCLNSDRRKILVENPKEKECFLQIIKDVPVPVPENLQLWMCWECVALLLRFSKFKQRVIHSYKTLFDLKLGVSKNVDVKYETRLINKEIFNISYDPDKSIDFFVEVIKTEFDDDIDSDIKLETDTYSNDDEKPLIELSKKRKKKKTNGYIKEFEQLEYVEIELSKGELEEERRELAKKDEYVNAMFKCERCIISFPNADDLNDHISLKHERNASLFKCAICQCSFSSEVSYNYHTKRHTQRYQCSVCSNKFTSKRGAIKHYNTVHCLGTDIGFVFEKKQTDELEEKLIEKFEESDKVPVSFPCEFCAKTFMWRTSLRKHLETHRIENGQKRRPYCEPCKLSFATTSNLQKHVKTSSKHQIQLKLRKLKESLPEDGEWPERSQAHVDEIKKCVNRSRQQFPCGQCGKTFQWRGNLQRHMRSHAAKAKGELVCVPCNRSFSSIATYKQHMAISKKHVSEEDFKYMCSDCGRKFSNKTRLKDHINWEHLKKYVHTCGDCQKVFKCHTSLYIHRQVVHKSETAQHLCDCCGKHFPNQAKLRNHMLALHSGTAAYRCTSCDAGFAWHSCLSRHVRRAHRKRPL